MTSFSPQVLCDGQPLHMHSHSDDANSAHGRAQRLIYSLSLPTRSTGPTSIVSLNCVCRPQRDFPAGDGSWRLHPRMIILPPRSASRNRRLPESPACALQDRCSFSMHPLPPLTYPQHKRTRHAQCYDRSRLSPVACHPQGTHRYLRLVRSISAKRKPIPRYIDATVHKFALSGDGGPSTRVRRFSSTALSSCGIAPAARPALAALEVHTSTYWSRGVFLLLSPLPCICPAL
ncbi:hypothetical protein C8Q70DRAFT_109941 [Cubamyces menziesii]|nr:hypothetical protein C8Q70DRAFT_109941 [Cubamyces menziesii]